MRDISPQRKRFVEVWSKAWGLVAATLVVWIAYQLPEQLRAGDTLALLRSVGLGLIAFNLIMQATRPAWPIVYALPLTVFGISLWVFGWLN